PRCWSPSRTTRVARARRSAGSWRGSCVVCGPRTSPTTEPAAPCERRGRASGEFGLLGAVEPAQLRGAARQSRARERARARHRPVGRSRRRRQLGAGRLVRAEDLGLGLAGQQALEVLALDRLPPDQDLADLLQALAMVGEDVLGLLVGGLDDAADLVVDLAGDLVRVVRLGGELAAQE